ATPGALTPASDAHGDPRLRQPAFDLGNGVLAVVKDRGTEDGVGSSFERLPEVVDLARAPRGDHGYPDDQGNRVRQLEVVPGVRAVPVHARQQDLAGATLGPLTRPSDGVATGRRAAAGEVCLPGPLASLGVDREDH